MSSYSLRKDSDVQYTVIKDSVPTYTMKFKNKSWSCDCPARKVCKHLAMIPAEDQVKRFPRGELEEAIAILDRVLHPYRYAVCGSYRRGAATSKDIDIIVMMPEEDFRQLPHNFEMHGFIKESGGVHKFTGTIRGIPVDVDRIADPSYFAAHLLYRTGPAAFNIKMRTLAKERGLVLNERVQAQNETQIFEMVGMTYITPEERK